MSRDQSRMSLSEYLYNVRLQDRLPDDRDEDEGDRAVLAALDALRVGVRPPTLADLAQSAANRRVWVEAAKLLEHERAARFALALTSPGVRLEDAVATPPLDEALVAALRQTDRALS